MNRTADLAALALTHQAHAAGLCGSVPDPGLIGAQLAHVQYEALCNGDEACEHARTIPPFRGGCDSRWTTTECCQWKALEHVFHTRWSDAQRRGDLAASREAGRDHENAHLCANQGANPEGTAGPIVIFSCAEEPQNVPQCLGPGGVRGKNTCRNFLGFLTAKLGG